MHAEIGELSIFARRSSDMWMLAVMNGGPARTIQVPLSFLGEGSYKASLVRDDKDNSGTVVLDSRTLGRNDMLTIEMVSGGGFIGRFTK